MNRNHGGSVCPYSFGHTLSRYHVSAAYRTQSSAVTPTMPHAVTFPSFVSGRDAEANVMPSLASSSVASAEPHWLMLDPGRRHTRSQLAPPLSSVILTAMAGAMLMT